MKSISPSGKKSFTDIAVSRYFEVSESAVSFNRGLT